MKKSVERFTLIFFIVSLATSTKMLLEITTCDGSMRGIALLFIKVLIMIVYLRCTYKIASMKVYVKQEDALFVKTWFKRDDFFDQVRETPIKTLYKEYVLKTYCYLFVWSGILVYAHKFWAIIIIAMIWIMYTRINTVVMKKMM